MSNSGNFLHELVGSMSQGAAGNPTVAMIEAAFAHHGLHWRYINMEVTPADLGAAVRGARAMGFRGFNCSLPHKVTVIAHLDGLGESAAVMGAVNCVVRRGDKLIGRVRLAVVNSSMSIAEIDRDWAQGQIQEGDFVVK